MVDREVDIGCTHTGALNMSENASGPTGGAVTLGKPPLLEPAFEPTARVVGIGLLVDREIGIGSTDTGALNMSENASAALELLAILGASDPPPSTGLPKSEAKGSRPSPSSANGDGGGDAGGLQAGGNAHDNESQPSSPACAPEGMVCGD